MMNTDDKLRLIRDTTAADRCRVMAYLQMRSIGSTISVSEVEKDLPGASHSGVTSSLSNFTGMKLLERTDSGVYKILASLHSVELRWVKRPAYPNGKPRKANGHHPPEPVASPPVDRAIRDLAEEAHTAILLLAERAAKGELSSYSTADLLQEINRRIGNARS